MSGRVHKVGETIRQVCDRFWLFTIAALALGTIAFILVSVTISGKMPEAAGELFTSAVTGLLMIVQKVIEAQQQRRMADQLAASAPSGPPPPGDAVDAANQVANAAGKEADAIGEQAK